jgi:hypothetical protein
MYSGGVIGEGESFTPTVTSILTSIAIRFDNKVGSPTGNVYAKLYAMSGNYGTSAAPTGSVLATSDPVDASVCTGLIAKTFSFTNNFVLTVGSFYVIVIEYSGGNTTNYIKIEHGAGGSGATGNRIETTNGTDWTTVSDDLRISIRGTPITPLIGKLSTTDDGFTAGHPFTSGAQITYTVQSALTPGVTYYWRVRAIDPSGSNTWGAWSDIYSFTTAAASTFIPRMIIF